MEITMEAGFRFENYMHGMWTSSGLRQVNLLRVFSIHYALCQKKDRLYVFFFFFFSRFLFFSHFARWMISRRETTNVKSIFHHSLISFKWTPLAHTAHIIKSRFEPYQHILRAIRIHTHTPTQPNGWILMHNNNLSLDVGSYILLHCNMHNAW